MNKPTFTKFHGSLFVIVLIIAATAFLLQNYGTVDRRDIAGLATEYMSIKIDEKEVIIENKGTYWEGKTESGVKVQYMPSTKQLFVDKNKDNKYGSDEVFTYSSGSVTTTAAPVTTAEPVPVAESTTTMQAPAAGATLKEPEKTPPPSFTLTESGELTVGEQHYNLIKGSDGNIYAGTLEKPTNENVYIDIGTGIKYDEDYKNTDRSSTFLTKELITEIKDSANYKKWEKAAAETPTEKIFTGKEEKRLAKEQEYAQLATTLGISEATVTELRNVGLSPEDIKAMYEDIPEQYRSSITAQMWIKEQSNINKYLEKQKLRKTDEEGKIISGVSYDVRTGHYSGTIDKYEISWNGDDIGVKVAGKTIYQTTDKSGKTTYYTCPKNDCSEKTEPEAETKDLRKTFRQAEKAEDKLAENVAENGKLVDENGNEILDKDGKPIPITTLRQAAYRQALYDQQEAQVKGILSGWLSNFLDKGSPLIGWGGLGGWSRGVPAGICANILGLEYYKEDGWTRVPMNSSAEQLQSQLIANSRTVIIEGEKEEITESLYRYAYTLRLLANQSVEWQTYLYNSCSQETSTEVFYDYGALATGAYYSFHYAGAGAEDMIFDCEQEECLFDQACVAFTDSSAPVCVSLVHGAGFETPNAGSDYDCI